jgi:hypothetical protein
VEFLPQDRERGRRLAMWGVVGAAYNAIVNSAFAVGNLLSFRTEQSAAIVHLVGSVLFVVVAYGIYRMSRIAAVFLLGLTVTYQLAGLIIGMHQIPSLVQFLLLVAAANGARGTVAYQRAQRAG